MKKAAPQDKNPKRLLFFCTETLREEARSCDDGCRQFKHNAKIVKILEKIAEKVRKIMIE